MASFNRVILMGNLTRDPEGGVSAGGVHYGNFDIAINDRVKRGDEWVEEATYVNRISVFGRQAENCLRYLKKGSGVLVEGRLYLDRWEKDGQTNSRLRVKADRVVFMPRAEKSDYSQSGGSRTTRIDLPPAGDIEEDNEVPF